MVALIDFRPADIAVISVAGVVAVLALLGAWLTIPWRQRSRRAKGTQEFNVLWRGRAVLELLCTLWALSQLLRITSLWGADSFVFGGGVTAWTSSGWMCRAYLAASLGVLQPLCATTTLLIFAAAVSRKLAPDPSRHPNARLVGLSLVLTIPIAAVQCVVAFLSLVIRYQGQALEAQPRSVLGYFFATYWQGDAQECSAGSSISNSNSTGGSSFGSSTTDTNNSGSSSGGGGCAACVFPAASVAAHAVFSLAFLITFWVLSSCTIAAVLNQRLRRRVRLFQALHSLLAVAGAGAMGASIVAGPFSWVNQGCWLGYSASVAATIALVSWELVMWPALDLRRANRRLRQWTADDSLNDVALGLPTWPGDPPSGLIKAHNCSSDAEAMVHAAAVARLMSAS